jgi:hypothetical protein
MELEQFVADCSAAVMDSAATQAVRETVARAVADPRALEQFLGAPEQGGIQRIHVSEELTILNVIWARARGQHFLAQNKRRCRWSHRSGRREVTAAIHVYGGDFFTTDRSEWETEGLQERPYDVNKTIKLFEDANKWT